MFNDPQKRIEKLEKEVKNLTEQIYSNNFSALQDFKKYSRFQTRLRVPVLSATPSTCEIGEVCVVSGTGKMYVCSSANTWTIIGTQS